MRPYAKEFYCRPVHDGACPICGALYTKDLIEGERYHRAEHRIVIETFEPRPNATLAGLYARFGTFIPVRLDSPRWVRRRLHRIGLMFRRELGFDFPPYDADEDDGHGYILADVDGLALGGCTVRWQEYENASPRWVLKWIWVVPCHRRRGLLRATWEMAKSGYPGIEPEPPFSAAAAHFFSERQDVSDGTRAWAEHALSPLVR